MNRSLWGTSLNQAFISLLNSTKRSLSTRWDRSSLLCKRRCWLEPARAPHLLQYVALASLDEANYKHASEVQVHSALAEPALLPRARDEVDWCSPGASLPAFALARPVYRNDVHLRAAAKSDFENEFFKLMKNSIYVKTCQNQKKRIDRKLNKTEQKSKMLVHRPHCLGFKIFNE